MKERPFYEYVSRETFEKIKSQHTRVVVVLIVV
jgi:hypothetical protein